MVNALLTISGNDSLLFHNATDLRHREALESLIHKTLFGDATGSNSLVMRRSAFNSVKGLNSHFVLKARHQNLFLVDYYLMNWLLAQLPKARPNMSTSGRVLL